MLLITVDNPADPAIHSNTMGSSTFNYLARCPTQKNEDAQSVSQPNRLWLPKIIAKNHCHLHNWMT